ncbi:MAG TPA: MarR family transcriptional regulator [Luteimicrobium sp.]|nr:MarR family transcriptional regulator [Luteimicrobium sp.]
MEQQTEARIRGADLATTLERVLRLTREMSTAGDLSSTAATVLYRLARSGPSRITDMAHTAGVSQPAMSQLVSRLEQDGLVDRAVDDDDRRAVLVAISEQGRAVIGARRAQRAAVFDEALRRLDAGDRVAIAAALPALDRLVDAVVEL